MQMLHLLRKRLQGFVTSLHSLFFNNVFVQISTNVLKQNSLKFNIVFKRIFKKIIKIFDINKL